MYQISLGTPFLDYLLPPRAGSLGRRMAILGGCFAVCVAYDVQPLALFRVPLAVRFPASCHGVAMSWL